MKIPLSAAVWVSKLDSIFQNLAIENWILKNLALDELDVLLIWRNRPCVVIGRHQNPWKEANIDFLNQNGIALARRYSGGGAVYHDLNTVNLSFITSRTKHNRRLNLEMLVDIAAQRWCINLSVNNRHDLLIDHQYKVSGTAAKITSKCAYHHLTLLLQHDEYCMSNALTPSLTVIDSKATASVRSRVGSLLSKNQKLTYKDVVNDISRKFLEQYEKSTLIDVDVLSESFFPGVTDSLAELQSWNWVYGLTPKFSVLTQSNFRIVVEKGVIVAVEQPMKNFCDDEQQTGLITSLLSQQFCSEMCLL